MTTDFNQRQKEIIDASISLIADKGIQNLTLKHISHEIGISEPAIYRYFKSKFEIVMGVLDTFEDISDTVLNSVEISKLETLNKIEFFLSDRYKRCEENPKLAKVMFSEEHFQENDKLSKKILHIMSSHGNEIQKIIVKCQEVGDIRNDISAVNVFRIIFGPMRLLIKQWGLSNYRFVLSEEGLKLWNSQKLLLKTYPKPYKRKMFE
ncbi:MAG: TetR/AcrR family transcriptional regulator [Caldisericia bacterium]|nr:TetR/AcrR family transcriptional regulator [Caldisericia bacterium]